MTSVQTHEAVDARAPEWRAAVVELEQARVQYARVLAQPDSEDRDVDRVWLRLWRAERRRDELIRR